MKKIVAIAAVLKRDQRARLINCANSSYTEAVAGSNGTPFVIPFTKNSDQLKKTLSLADALLLPGGIDVHPQFFEQDMKEKLDEVDSNLDLFHFELCRSALEQKMPILGICRGCQVLNVALGGSLLQDNSYLGSEILMHQQKADGFEVAHKIFIEKDSRLAAIWGAGVMVNSYHHQSVDKPGRGLKITARASDNTVEAVEAVDHPFVIGVQWHPELMTAADHNMKPLFDAFIDSINKDK